MTDAIRRLLKESACEIIRANLPTKFRMTPETIYAKSSKGIQEIETRAHKLASRLRQALIRIDGIKTMDELIEGAGEMAEAFVTHVEELEKEGFITDITSDEAVSTAPLTAPIPEPAPAPPPPAPPPAPRATHAPAPAAHRPAAPKPGAPVEPMEYNSPVKFKLQDLLVEALGMETGKAGIALGNCRNRDDLARWVDLVVGPIESAAGRAKAKTFHKAAKKLIGG
jgi:hypothetical protein